MSVVDCIAGALYLAGIVAGRASFGGNQILREECFPRGNGMSWCAAAGVGGAGPADACAHIS